MSIVTRREREKLEMRQLIVDAAIKIYLEEGYDKLSLRGIAQKIEYSPGTIYLYFKDKHELFHAMHERAFMLLLDKFRELDTIKNPLERLENISRAFMHFGLSNPQLYDLMFILNEPMCADANMEDWKCGLAAYEYLKTTVQECIDADILTIKDADLASFMFFSSVHGMISLHLRNRLKMYEHLPIEGLMKMASEQLLAQFIKK